MIAVGLKIRNVRVSWGLSVEFLARELEVSRTYLTLIENGKRHLPKKLVEKLAKAFRLPKETVYEWYFEQELEAMDVKNKKSRELIFKILKMTPREKESLLKAFQRGPYHDLVEISPDATVLIDLNKKIISANRQTLLLLGFRSEAEMCSKIKNIFNNVILKDRQYLINSVQQVLETGIALNIELVLIRKDGTSFPAEVSISLIKGKERKPESFLVIIRDITERKRAEEKKRENWERYRQLAESISDVFFAMNKDLRYTYWNKASENLIGISAKDAIGKSIFEIFPDNEETKKAVDVYRKVLRTQLPQTFINEYHLGGKIFFFEISVHPSMYGISVFVKDITERKGMEKKLSASEKRFRIMINTSPDPICTIGFNGNILFVNLKFEEISGYKEEEILGQNFKVLAASPKTIQVANKAIARLLKTGISVPIKVIMKTKFREEKTLEVRASILSREKGGEILLIARDITDRK